MRLALPRGSRDILPTEARELHAIRQTLLDAFGSYGYVPLEPPTLELARADGSVDERRVLRFLDRDGSLLALRPDLTTAVARVVAQRYRDARDALRLSYVATVFRQEHSMRGSEREYDQAGVELIGPLGPLADVEVVALLADALSRCGLGSAEIDVGHAGFVGAFFDDLDPQVREDALARGRAGDLVGLIAVARAAGLAPDRVERLRAALRHRGGLPMAARGSAATLSSRSAMPDWHGDLPAGSIRALDELRAFDALLAAAAPSLPVRYDLGLIAPLPYYTGIVFQATAPGLGFPVASGGRYDDLLARYGPGRPAVGFGITLPHLHQALLTGSGVATDPSPLVTLDGAAPADILAVAAELRRAGLAVSIGGVADSAGRPVVPLRVVDGEHVEHNGRVATIGDVGVFLSGRSSRPPTQGRT